MWFQSSRLVAATIVKPMFVFVCRLCSCASCVRIRIIENTSAGRLDEYLDQYLNQHIDQYLNQYLNQYLDPAHAAHPRYQIIMGWMKTNYIDYRLYNVLRVVTSGTGKLLTPPPFLPSPPPARPRTMCYARVAVSSFPI